MDLAGNRSARRHASVTAHHLSLRDTLNALQRAIMMTDVQLPVAMGAVTINQAAGAVLSARSRRDGDGSGSSTLKASGIGFSRSWVYGDATVMGSHAIGVSVYGALPASVVD